MNRTKLVSIALSVALLGTNLYWRQREHTVRESLTASRNWHDTTQGFQEGDMRAAQEAADALNTRIEDLPERVERVDEERRDLRRELDRVREQWVDAWWNARVQRPIDLDGPHVLAVMLENGTTADVEAFAENASEHDQGITIVAGQADGAYAVAVGDTQTEEFGAADIAEDIAAIAGGGAGGSVRLAVGGGATGDLEEAIEAARDRIVRTSAFE